MQPVLHCNSPTMLLYTRYVLLVLRTNVEPRINSRPVSAPPRPQGATPPAGGDTARSAPCTSVPVRCGLRSSDAALGCGLLG